MRIQEISQQQRKHLGTGIAEHLMHPAKRIADAGDYGHRGTRDSHDHVGCPVVIVGTKTADYRFYGNRRTRVNMNARV